MGALDDLFEELEELSFKIMKVVLFSCITLVALTGAVVLIYAMLVK